jgi:hypothetical protein
MSASGRVGTLLMMGKYLRRQFDESHRIDDLNQAIWMMQQAATEAWNAQDSNCASCFNHVGEALFLRYSHGGSREDLEYALASWSSAVSVAEDQDPDFTKYLTNLGTALSRRFYMDGGVNDLDRSITSTERAIDLAQSDHDIEISLNNLGNCLLRRYRNDTMNNTTNDIARTS